MLHNGGVILFRRAGSTGARAELWHRTKPQVTEEKEYLREGSCSCKVPLSAHAWSRTPPSQSAHIQRTCQAIYSQQRCWLHHSCQAGRAGPYGPKTASQQATLLTREMVNQQFIWPIAIRWSLERQGGGGEGLKVTPLSW